MFVLEHEFLIVLNLSSCVESLVAGCYSALWYFCSVAHKRSSYHIAGIFVTFCGNEKCSAIHEEENLELPAAVGSRDQLKWFI